MIRITTDPRQMGGQPCIQGLRIPVITVLDLLANGYSYEEVLADYPDLRLEDLHAAIGYAGGLIPRR